MIKLQRHLVLFLAASFFASGGASTLQAQQPNPPTNVIASAQLNQVQITWDAGKNAANYLIYRYEVTPGVFLNESTLVANTPIGNVTGLSFTDPNPVAGTIYMYVVQSQNSSGTSSLQGNSNYSCGRPVASGDTGTYPTIRPLVYMAAHGSDGVSIPTQDPAGSMWQQDPTAAEVAQSTSGVAPLINYKNYTVVSPLANWSTVASCLDGIWGNYAKVSADDENSLYTTVNTKNTIAVQDISAGKALADPTLPSYDPPGINLNRRGMAIYAAPVGVLGGADTTLTKIQDTYTAADVKPTPYERIYTGFNLNAWVDPYSQTSGLAPGTPGVYTYPNATNIYLNVNGAMQECDNGPDGGDPGAGDTCDGTLGQGLLNNLIQTRMQTGSNFILFFAVGAAGGVGPNLGGYPTTGALSQLQKLYNQISSAPCSGTYDAANSAEGVQTPYNFCADNPSGLWRRGDVVLVINYQGWYPSTPEFSGPSTFEDSATGLLAWLITR